MLCLNSVFFFFFLLIKKDCLVRLILAAGLIIGGIIAAIGYWALAGAFDTDSSPSRPSGGTTYSVSSGNEDEYRAFYVGYTITLAGLCFVWALDIAFDDVKGYRNNKR